MAVVCERVEAWPWVHSSGTLRAGRCRTLPSCGRPIHLDRVTLYEVIRPWGRGRARSILKVGQKFGPGAEVDK